MEQDNSIKHGTPTDSRLLSHKEAAAYLNIADQTLYNWRSRGMGPDYAMVGRRRMYRPQALDSYIKSNTIILNS